MAGRGCRNNFSNKTRDIFVQKQKAMIGDTAAEDLWKLQKWAMFSASKIDVLNNGTDEALFGKGAMTYINGIAREGYTTFNDDENVETFSMKRGKMKEAEAFAHYWRFLGSPQNMEYFGGSNPYFEHYCPDSGASPDALMWIDKAAKLISWGAEIKCPKSDTHWDYLEFKDQWDLKKAEPNYYGQCQFGMMTFKTDLWHWCSYNEYYPVEDRMTIIEVKEDKVYQSNLAMRLKQAVKKKWEIVEQKKKRHLINIK